MLKLPTHSGFDDLFLNYIFNNIPVYHINQFDWWWNTDLWQHFVDYISLQEVPCSNVQYAPQRCNLVKSSCMFFFLYFFYHALKCLHIFLAKYLPKYCTTTCLVNLVVNPGCRNRWLFKVQLCERAHMQINFTML